MEILDWAEGNAEKLVQKYLDAEPNEVFSQNELKNKGDYYIGTESSGDGETVFVDICFGDEFEKHDNNLEKNYEYFTRYAEDISDNMNYDVTVMTNSDDQTIMFQFTDWFPEESEEPEEYAKGGKLEKAYEVILQLPNGKMNKRAVLLAKTKDGASKKALNLKEFKQYGYVVISANEIKYAKGGQVLDLKDVYNELRRKVGRLEINEETKENINCDIRDWGNWEHDYEDYERDEEDFEDDDSMILSESSGKKMQSIVEEIRTKYPTASIRWSTSEKNYIDFQISRKMAEGGKLDEMSEWSVSIISQDGDVYDWIGFAKNKDDALHKTEKEAGFKSVEMDGGYPYINLWEFKPVKSAFAESFERALAKQMRVAKSYWNKFDKKQRIDFLLFAGYSKMKANNLSLKKWDSLDEDVHNTLRGAVSSGYIPIDDKYEDGGKLSNGKTINGYDVHYFKTGRWVYANIEIPSPNPTFDDDTQIKGVGKDEKEAFNDLKKEFEKYLDRKKMANGGELDDDTFVMLFKGYGFVEKRGSYGSKTFYNKEHNAYIYYDPKYKSLSGYVGGGEGNDEVIPYTVEGVLDFFIEHDISESEATPLGSGGMTAGRWYPDKTGEEFRYIGEDGSGKSLFNDGQKVVSKPLEDFEPAPREKKLFKFFRMGGALKNDFLEDVAEMHNEIKEITLKDGSKITHDELMEAHQFLEPDETQEYYASMQYGKGGTFDSKVQSISKKLVGKPVPKQYRKEYGSRYDKDDAQEAARRIVGNMRKLYGE